MKCQLFDYFWFALHPSQSSLIYQYILASRLLQGWVPSCPAIRWYRRGILDQPASATTCQWVQKAYSSDWYWSIPPPAAFSFGSSSSAFRGGMDSYNSTTKNHWRTQWPRAPPAAPSYASTLGIFAGSGKYWKGNRKVRELFSKNADQ